MNVASRLLWLIAQDLGRDGVNRVAEVCEVSRSTAYSWVKGYALPSLEVAHRIEDRFGISARAWLSDAPDWDAPARAENERAKESSPELRTVRARAGETT